MPRVLLTAFEPYGQWVENASWLLVQQLTRDLPSDPQVTTRLYPVDFAALRSRLESDLRENFDVVLMLGQAPGSANVNLEAVGVNVGQWSNDTAAEPTLIAEDGPVGYRSTLPLHAWAEQLGAAGIPTAVSYHAGTYLCNAALYLAHYFIERMSLNTQAAFVHVPLAPSQVIGEAKPLPSAPTEMTAAAVALLLQ